jgi:hypothetical protein
VKGLAVRSPLLGLLGLVAVGLVAVQLYQGDLTITQAAVRLGILQVALLLTDRLLVPLAHGLAHSGRQPEPAEADPRLSGS